jgi:hypothetical protein
MNTQQTPNLPHWALQWNLTLQLNLTDIADLSRSALTADGSVNPSVDLASVLSQILNIATNGTEGDKP